MGKENFINDVVYCGVDLEFTGFDPSKAEIIEVGLCFFRLQKKGIKVLEQWTKVFKPSGTVSQNILGLTGISEIELENAEKFDQYRDWLTEKLEKVVVVGHNVGLDMRFLESYGVKLSGEKIDTMDLVQIFLPTYHSYNLENLAHYFGITHKNAHRALSDAIASAELLEKIASIYNSYPDKLQEKVKKIVKKSSFDWISLLEMNEVKPFSSQVKLEFDELKEISEKRNESRLVKSINLKQDLLKTTIYEAFGTKDENVLVVVPEKKQVFEVMNKYKIDGLFLPSDTFDNKLFSKFDKKKNKTSDEVKFFLKTLIWKETNWQSISFKDLNLNFFGNQFVNYIQSKKKRNKFSGKLICDANTFAFYSKNDSFSKFKLNIVNLEVFELEISKMFGSKTSWNSILYSLKSVYNPESGYGELAYKDEIIKAISDTDLFFALFMLYLRPKGVGLSTVSRDDLDLNFYEKVRKAAVNYKKKMLRLSSKVLTKQLKESIKALDKFFAEDNVNVKWVEFGEGYCALLTRPLNITKGTKNVLKNNDSVTFWDSGLGKETFEYFSIRLGLKDFKLESNKKSLFFEDISIDTDETIEDLSKKIDLPGAILFQGPALVKKFYEDNHLELKKRGNLLALNITGGGNKLLKNFRIKDQSLMLATVDFFGGPHTTNATVNTLVIPRKIKIDIRHPYIKSLFNEYKILGIDLEEVLGELKLRNLFVSFYSKRLKKVIRYE